jgi:hypothetical protein
MTLGYLVLAVTLAVSLNHRNRFVRASGTLLAAVCLLMIVLSIVLAHFDASFAALRGNARRQLRLCRSRPARTQGVR